MAIGAKIGIKTDELRHRHPRRYRDQEGRRTGVGRGPPRGPAAQTVRRGRPVGRRDRLGRAVRRGHRRGRPRRPGAVPKRPSSPSPATAAAEPKPNKASKTLAKASEKSNGHRRLISAPQGGAERDAVEDVVLAGDDLASRRPPPSACAARARRRRSRRPGRGASPAARLVRRASAGAAASVTSATCGGRDRRAVDRARVVALQPEGDAPRSWSPCRPPRRTSPPSSGTSAAGLRDRGADVGHGRPRSAPRSAGRRAGAARSSARSRRPC